MMIAAAFLLALSPAPTRTPAVMAPPPRPTPAWQDAAGPVTKWPRVIPARTRPEGRDEILVTTLGEVATPLANATFDPVADRLTMNDGRVVEGYYKNVLEIPFYTPVDKSRYPVPPSGWCSWYYYYQEITPEEVMLNARWIAKNLAPYGARFVQLDDGWQGKGRGGGDNRDWTTIDQRFAKMSMPGLAKAITALGLDAGIWLAPHGQSHRAVVDKWGAFLLNENGDSASKSWEGDFLVDPTHPNAGAYLRDLFATMRSWGYTYFKIDSQMIVLREYRRPEVQARMKGPLPEGKPADIGVEVYRRTMPALREGIGPESFLLSCWGIPLHAMGFVNGSRTAGDVVQSWDGYLIAAMAVQQWNFLHNVAWYSDPDVLELRPPLPDNIARAWAAIFGLTGQNLLTSDRLPDLPPSRVKMLRQVYPAVDIRPLDLFPPENILKPVIDLKVNHLGRQYDVVGVFNQGADQVYTRLVSWKELGLDPKTPHHVWDFFDGSYLGAWEDGVILDVPPSDVKVLSIVPAKKDRPVLISTDRHLTQGWVDLLELAEAGTETAPVVRGRSRVHADDPYTMAFGLPRAKSSLRIASVKVMDAAGRPVPAAFDSHLGFATVTIRSPKHQAVSWSVQFEPAEQYTYPVQVTSGIAAVPRGANGGSLWWRTENHLRAGYRVEVDGEPVGVAFNPRAVVSDLAPGRSYKIGVRSIWYDGTVSEKVMETTLDLAVPAEAFLSDWEPAFLRETWRNLWRSLGRDRSADGRPLTVAGKTYAKGLGSHTEWDVHYDLGGAFSRFGALVGVDDEVVAQIKPGTDGTSKPVGVVFEVWGDGKALWKSEPVRSGQAPVPVDVDVTGVKMLALKTLNGPDHQGLGHGDWLEAKLVR
jgi:NPCBM/NEW2 domain-containing protein